MISYPFFSNGFGVFRTALRLSLWLFLTGALASTGHAETCSVSRLAGSVAVAPGDGSGERPLQPDDIISAGAIVQTGSNARATLICAEGLTVVLAPDTRLEIDRVLASASTGGGWFGGGQMRLMQGAAGFLLNRVGGGRFRVRTPDAVAAVRSTEWAMEVGAKGTAVFVREGAVRVSGGGGAEILGAADGIDIRRFGPIGPVKTWGAGRVAALDARIGPTWR